tara:strand:- start:823 stop:2883 length:2061 start_codon:yes stop_codon:yes gene_type:complete
MSSAGKSGVKNVFPNGKGWFAAVHVNGKQVKAPTRATIPEAEADVQGLLQQQQEARDAKDALREASGKKKAVSKEPARSSGVKHVQQCRSGWIAVMSVGGKTVSAKRRDTVEEAAADVPDLLRQQQAAIQARVAKRNAEKAEIREKHAMVAEVKHVYAHGNRFCAMVGINNKNVRGPSCDTAEEAASYVPGLLERQRQAKEARIEKRDAREESVREEQAERLDDCEMCRAICQNSDRLSREFLALALQDNEEVGVVNGVEYSIDMHAYRRADDLGFDELLDVELDDGVPTLAIELKATSFLGKNVNLYFQHIHYATRKSTLVVCLYIPADIKEATRETLKSVRFFYKHAYGWELPGGTFRTTLHAKDASKRLLPSHLLGEKVAREVLRHAEANRLVPYGHRKRQFKNVTTDIGQRAIDAFETQVLIPKGARFLPTESGCEGGADDRRIQYSDGTMEVAQIKKVSTVKQQAGFHVKMKRHHGSIIDAESGDRIPLFNPYTEGENDRYIFVALDASDHVAEYWAPSESDLIGSGSMIDRLIRGKDGKGGVVGFFVHPNIEDKERFGDTVANNDSHDTRQKLTRTWIRSLGEIMSPTEAAALKARLDDERRALRLSAKAQRALDMAQHAVETAESKAGPSNTTINHDHSTNHNTTNVTNVHIHMTTPAEDAERAAKRLCSDLRGYFLKK